MSPELEKRIGRLAADRTSGASEILEVAIAILRDALDADADMPAVARAVCAAQPQMAPVYNAAIAALATREQPGRFDTFVQRVARAPEALARFAVECCALSAKSVGSDEAASDERTVPMCVATLSYRRTVLQVLEALARERPLRVACSESRPALEGRKLASRLVSMHVPVTLFTDAAIGHALGDVDAVIVGADAVAPTYFLNKSGTRMLAAAASHQGVPVYVVASRDKFVSEAVAARLHSREGAPAEVWDHAPEGLNVRNPYFESTPLELVTSVISDVGLLNVAAVPEVCASVARQIPSGLLELL
jgi:translation initiation factor 2B subunit (eIF-2B alpha/beta/delta family)